MSGSRRFHFDDWEREAESWYQSQGFAKTRVAEKMEPAAWAAWWAECDIATAHPQLEDLRLVAAAHRRSSDWIDVGFALAGHELLRFKGILSQPEIPLVVDLSVAEVRKALQAARAGHAEPKRGVVDWVLDLDSLPDNPYLRLLEVVSLLSQWEKAHKLLRATMESWLTRMAWRQGVPLKSLAEAAGRPTAWVRHKVGGTPPPQPVVSLSWWKGERVRREQFG